MSETSSPLPPTTSDEDISSRSWLSGLIVQEGSEDQATPHGVADPVGPPMGLKPSWNNGEAFVDPRFETGHRTWHSDIDEPERELGRDEGSTRSWLSGLVKEEKRPAINDIARLILGNSAPNPAPVPSQNESDPFAPAASTCPVVESQDIEPPPTEVTKSQLPQTEERTILPRGLEDLPPPAEPVIISVPLPKPEIVKRQAKASTASSKSSAKPLAKPKLKSIPARDKVSFFRALAAMFEAGVPLFAIFEFLAREGENETLATASRSVGQNLVAGWSLSAAAAGEPQLFDVKAVRLLEVGYRSGKLDQILAQLADDEEHAWKIKQSLKSQLTYPLGIALLTLVAVILLPPLVLTDLLKQVVSLTAEPPLLTQALLSFSAFLGSPWVILTLGSLVATVVYGLRTARGQELRENFELAVWFLPALGQLWRNVVGLRFMRVFSTTYRAGLPAVLGMELAASATGSQLAYRVFPLMKNTLVEGGSLAESFAAGGFLPPISLEAVSAGELSGKVPAMLESASEILEAEVQSRIDAVAKLIEPLVLACLGMIVGVFVLGCLLPIVELTSSL